MNKIFKDFATYVRLHDWFLKPKIDFQTMYKMFPDFTFEPCDAFGKYVHFGEAYEHKDLSMNVRCGVRTCTMIYKEYQDADEHTAYVV